MNQRSSPAPRMVSCLSDNVIVSLSRRLCPIPKTQRRRDKRHFRSVSSQPCLVCGRAPLGPHHLRFAEPRAFGLKVSDEFTVPLCRTHHRALHSCAMNAPGGAMCKSILPRLLNSSSVKLTPPNKCLDVDAITLVSGTCQRCAPQGRKTMQPPTLNRVCASIAS